MGLFNFGRKEEKSVPAVANINEATRNGLQKAYIPMFLYKPPFGYPRYTDLPMIRRLATSPYVEMCITTIIDEMCSIPWDIVPKKEMAENKEHVKQVKDFFEDPNTNKESFEEIRRKYLRDILEVDAGVLNKIFNQKGEMVEIVARDGATFTKNPDMYGMFTEREDLLLQYAILPQNKEASAMAVEPGFITAADAREKAAYFQYGWISGARPVPFGKKEIVWFERNPRTDSIYGRSPIEVLAETIQTLIYAIEHNLEYFNDNSIPKGVIGLEGSNSEEVEAFKDQWIDQQRKKDSAGNWKKNFHNIPIVGRKPEFVRFELTNSELELLEGQKWWAKLVWASFGVTSVELGYTEDAKGLANQIVQSNVFKKRCIYPLLRLEEYRINKELISEFEFDDVEFKFILFDVEEELKKAQLYTMWLNSRFKSINEIRREEGMEEVEWGDNPDQNNQFGDPNMMEDKWKQKKEQGSIEKENNEKKKESEKEKENMKAMQTDNPLILRENEELGEAKLKKSIVYILRENEKKIKQLIEKEIGKDTIKEIKSVDDIAKRMKDLLTFEGIKLISDAVIKDNFLKGWEESEKELNKNFIINKNALDYIQNYTFSNIKSMTEEIANDLKAELERGIMNGEGITKIKDRVSKVFNVGETRAEAIARTETTRAENQGRLQAVKSSGLKLKKKWVAAMDDRTSEECKRLHGQVVGIDENFEDFKSGFEGPCPPAHVNCRSTVIFFEEEQ